MAQHGMGVRVASALDTAVGMNSGLAAASLVAPDHAAGLATQRLFVEDVAPPRPVVDGMMSTTGATPDPDRLSALAAAPQRRDWWIRRVRSCWLELHP